MLVSILSTSSRIRAPEVANWGRVQLQWCFCRRLPRNWLILIVGSDAVCILSGATATPPKGSAARKSLKFIDVFVHSFKANPIATSATSAILHAIAVPNSSGLAGGRTAGGGRGPSGRRTGLDVVNVAYLAHDGFENGQCHWLLRQRWS